MVIQIDTRQKALPHNLNIESYIKNSGIEVVKSKVLVGDYIIPAKGNISVDTKQNMEELYKNLVTEHLRFSKECQLAKKCGIKLYILTANDCGIKCIEDVASWRNPLQEKYNSAKGKPLYPPKRNETLIKIMKTMTERYGVEFLFCDDKEAGKRIIELLNDK